MVTRTLLPLLVAMSCLSTVSVAADGDRAAAEQWLFRAVESSKQIKGVTGLPEDHPAIW